MARYDLKHHERMELFREIKATLNRISWKRNAMLVLVGILYADLLIFCFLIARRRLAEASVHRRAISSLRRVAS